MKIKPLVNKILGVSNEGNFVFPLEITPLDKLIISMFIALPPMPQDELKQILWYIASPQMINASFKRLEDMKYIYQRSSSHGAFWTYGISTVNLLKSGNSNIERPTISVNRLQLNRLKAFLLLQQVQTELRKSLYSTEWDKLTESEKESIILTLYVRCGPFSDFQRSDKQARTVIVTSFHITDEEKQSLINMKSYNVKLLQLFISQFDTNDTGYRQFRINFLKLVKKKSDRLVDILTREMAIPYDTIQKIFISGILGDWRVSKKHISQFYASAVLPEKHNPQRFNLYLSILKKLKEYDINNRSIKTKSSVVAHETNKEVLENLYSIIDNARARNKELKKDIAITGLTDNVLSYCLLEDNGIIISQIEADKVTFYLLQNSEKIRSKEFTRKLMLCSKFAALFERKAHITITSISENDTKYIKNLYTTVCGKGFKEETSTTVSFKTYQPAKEVKHNIIKDLMGGGDNV